jgi:primary-amine oxidase
LVKKEIQRLKLPEGAVVIAEPWPYGTDDEKVATRMFQVWFFLNLKEHADHPSANFYAHPLDFGMSPGLATLTK